MTADDQRIDEVVGAVAVTSERLTTDATAIIASLPEATIMLQGGVITHANNQAVAVLGYGDRPSDCVGTAIGDLLHSKDKEAFDAGLAAAVEGTDSAASTDPFIIRIFRPDTGAVSWLRLTLTIAHWMPDQALICAVADVTSDMRDPESSKRMSIVYRRAFRLAPELMLLLRLRDGVVADANPAFVNTVGIRRDQIIGNQTQRLNIWADSTFYGRFWEELKSNASMSNIPVVIRARGGLIRHFRLFAHKVLEEDAEPMLLVIGQDVTDDLAQANELQRSRDMAELANRAKSEFLANMSHELRTPLNAILGFSEIIKDEVFGAVQNTRYQEYAADIHQSGSHLLSIINDILDLSKVEAGHLEAHLSWLDPSPGLQMSLSLIGRRAHDAGVTLTSDFDERILLEVDARLLKQIALNLLSNAVKFTDAAGQVCLSLRTSRDSGAILAVEDTGIGMTAEEIRIAKRPFGQVDLSHARRQEGSGLGLPLVAAFAEKMGASLHINSVPGSGTKVFLTFPPEKVRIRREEDLLD